ncbi:PqqD family protein [Meiothermus taiwanensis]|uniref:PqqD family protein n=1 Tax=Meiothermus taiwanensis TaxID=172827 RepID=UPI000E65C25D|nr:PqqD family protein [Meiothermus taiwanensis]
MAITPLYRRIQDAATDLLDGRTVVYDPNSGKFFGLNRSATCLWEFLEEWRSLNDIKTLLCRMYSLDEKIAEQDAEHFIAEMIRIGLVEQSKAGVVL